MLIAWKQRMYMIIRCRSSQEFRPDAARLYELVPLCLCRAQYNGWRLPRG